MLRFRIQNNVNTVDAVGKPLTVFSVHPLHPLLYQVSDLSLTARLGNHHFFQDFF